MSFKLPESRGLHVLVDPCAGDGRAIDALRSLWFGPIRTHRTYDVLDARIFAVELERERFRAADKRMPAVLTYGERRDTVLEADAFHVEIRPSDGASLLFLNPPYDIDPVHGRLEQRFLARWTECLLPGDGVLIFLVPHYALKASAAFLACHYADVRVWRFPDEAFAAFRQCVLLARRRGAPLPENDLDRRRIERWSEAPELLPELAVLPSPAFTIAGVDPGLKLVRMELDLQTMVDGFTPWMDSARFGTHRSLRELIGARYEVALPPRPAHIALALSAGMLNGKRLTPNRPGLPPLLVKGAFRREFVNVETKYNRDGEKTGTVQVQRPKLTLHALRLDTLKFLEFHPGAVPSGATDLADFNSADLVAAYGDSLGRLMRDQLPALHDPARPGHAMALPSLGRRPFPVQKELITAGLKLLAQGENPLVAAEVGTGKSTVSLSIAGCLAPEHFAHTTAELRRLGFDPSGLRPVRRILVLAPPHLLKSWQDQAAAVLPGRRVQIVEDLADLDRPAEIYLLSRERAKLGHGWQGLSRPPGRPGAEPQAALPRHCPRCGQPVWMSADLLATRRERCGSERRQPTNPAAALAEELAVVLFRTYPYNPRVRSLLVNRQALWRSLPEPVSSEEMPVGPLPRAAKLVAIASRAVRLLAGRAMDYRYGSPELRRAICRIAALAGEAGGAEIFGEVLAQLRRIEAEIERLKPQADQRSSEIEALRRQAGVLTELVKRFDKPALEPPPSGPPLLEALEALVGCGTWEEAEPCPEPLFQAIPEPRRYPIARHLLRRRHRLACNPDLLIIDEIHEMSNLGSAQQKAAHRLVELPGVPTLALSGSLMGGYASSLFANFWALSQRFRRAFRRTEKGAFVSRYGYRKVFVPVGQEGQDEVVGFGAKSDREDRREASQVRQIGEAPGILPLFLLEHLLPTALIMHKEDLEGELPPCRELPVPIEVAPDDEDGKALLAEQKRLVGTLMRRIQADLYTQDAGKLWGAMSLVPSYLDRCTDDLPPFRLQYPEEMGGLLVAEGKAFPASWRTPKERWLLERVRESLAEGRKVLIFLLHTGKSGLPNRYLRLFRDELGERAVFLDVAKVKAAEREAWLDAQVIEPGHRILITHPRAVQTGLNNLVAFSRAIWAQGLDYDARVVRQANGRVHRIGQTLDVTIEVPYYAGTVQKLALDLVARKISASVQVDGLSLEGALEGAGAGEGDDEANRAALGMGQAIYEGWRGAC